MTKQVWRMVLSCMLIVQLCMGGAVAAFAEDDDYTPPGNAVPDIALLSGPIFDVSPGTETEIELILKNGSAFRANSISIHTTYADIQDAPFTTSFAEGGNKISALAPKAETRVIMKVNMDRTAATKNYTATLNYTFFNEYNAKFTGTSTIYFRVKNTQGAADYSLENLTLSPQSMNPGDHAAFKGEIRNTGVLHMFDVKLSLEGLTPEGVGVSGLGTRQFSKISSVSSVPFDFTLTANPDMKPGSYPVTLKLKYKDAAGKDYESSQNYYVSVGQSAGGKSALQILNMKEPKGVYGVNQNFTISFDLKNTGAAEAKNVKITAAGVGEGSAVVPKSTSMQVLDKLAPGATAQLSFMFAGTSAAGTQNYPISFTVEYQTGSSDPVTFQQFAGVNINNPDKEEEGEDGKDKKTSKPKIIVSEYRCDPLIVMAGEEFDLFLSLTNTHTQKEAKNIKMFLTLAEETSADSEKTGNIFTPVDSSNTFYFDSIGPKGTTQRQLRLFVVPDAQPKTYTLTVNFEYEDAKGNEYTATELLGINVKQVTQLDVDDFVLPEQVEMGMPVPVSFSYYNTGKVTLNNLMISLEGEMDTQNRNTYIGNLESGNSDYFDGEFYLNAMGDTPVSVVISYDDPSGEKVEIRRDFTIKVTEPVMPEDMPGMEGPEKESPSLLKKILIGGGIVLVIAGAAAFFLIRRKRRKAAADILVDEDWESTEPEAKKESDIDASV